MRRIRRAVLAAVLLTAVAVPAHAMNWSLGANLGMSITMPDESENATQFGWPLAPGIRVGFAGGNPQSEFYALTELDIFSQDEFSASSVLITGNYQYNFPTSGNNGMFLTGGAGFNMQRVEDDTFEASATTFLFGGGVGMRHKMGNGHGVLRGELRYDISTEGEDDDVVIVESAGILSVRLGFDLWDQ